MSKSADPRVIGGFVLGAAALVVAGLLVLGGGKFFKKTTPIVMFFQGSVSGLSVGSPVNFRGVRVGEVTNVFIRYQPDGTVLLTIPVFAEISTDNVQIVGPAAEKKEVRRATDHNLREIVEQGLRAQLALPSLVTGQATVSLDFFPDTQMEFSNIYPQRVEIPTVPSTLQEVQTTLQKVYEKLSALPLDDLVADTQQMVKGASQLVNDPNLRLAIADAAAAMGDLQRTTAVLEQRVQPLIGGLEAATSNADRALEAARDAIVRADARSETTFRAADDALRQAQQTLAQAEKTLKSVDGAVAPGAPVTFELVAALKEVGAAARSLRSLSDALERNPNALLFGRPPTASR